MYRESIDDVIKYYAEGGNVANVASVKTIDRDPLEGFTIDQWFEAYKNNPGTIQRIKNDFGGTVFETKEQLLSTLQQPTRTAEGLRSYIAPSGKSDVYSGYKPDDLLRVANEYQARVNATPLSKEQFTRDFQNNAAFRNSVLQKAGEQSSIEAKEYKNIYDKFYGPDLNKLYQSYATKENDLKNQIETTIQRGKQDTTKYLNNLVSNETNALLNSPAYKNELDALRAALPKMQAAPLSDQGFTIEGISSRLGTNLYPFGNETDKQIAIQSVAGKIQRRENQAKLQVVQDLMAKYDVPFYNYAKDTAFDFSKPGHLEDAISAITQIATPIELENRVAGTLNNLYAQKEALQAEKDQVLIAYNDRITRDYENLSGTIDQYAKNIEADTLKELKNLKDGYIKTYGEDGFYGNPKVLDQYNKDYQDIQNQQRQAIDSLYSSDFDFSAQGFAALREQVAQENLAKQEARRAADEAFRIRNAELIATGQVPHAKDVSGLQLSPIPFPDMSGMQPLLPPTTGLTPQQAQNLIDQTLANFAQASGRPVDAVRAANQDAINAAIETARRTDLTPTTQAPTTQAPTGGQPFPYQPLATPLSKSQADALAAEFFAFSNINRITDSSGNPIPNPTQYLSGLIQQYGPQSVSDYFTKQGVSLTGTAPKLAPEIADKVANSIITSLGPTYDPKTDPNFANVKLALQNLGLEEGLAQFAKDNKVSVDSLKAALKPLGTSKPTVIYDADGTPIETSKGLDIYEDLIAQSNALMSAYKDTKTKEFQSSIDAILAGSTTARPQVPTNITPEEAVRQVFTAGGIDPAKEQQAYSEWVNYFTNVGIGPGMAKINEIIDTTRPGGNISLYGAPEVFNFGATSGAGTAPTYRPPAATQPTYTTPSYAYTPSTGGTGAPSGAGLGAIYQSPGATPAPYEARPLITRAERPTLDAGVQYIESTRPGAGPMPYMTAEQVGATPVQPASYADLFGYTPYTEYMGQSEYTTPMTANLYAAGYEANIPTRGMREGGSVAQEARGLAAMGRGGDSMLVHMAPEEVAGLRALAMREGTDLTINPETGLPEAKRLKRLFKQVILPAAAAYFGAPYLGGIGNAAMLYGAATAAKTGNLERGIMAGLTAYGGATAAEGMFGASPFQPTPTPAPNVAPVAPSTGPSVGTSSGGVESGRVSGGYGDFTGVQAAALTPPPPPPPPPAAATSAQTAQVAAQPQVGKFQQVTGMSPTTALIGGTMLAGLGEGEKERDMYEAERRRQQEEEERKKRLGMESFARATGPVDTRALYGAGGGLVVLARGGMTYMEAGGTTGPTGQPRMVAGNGDGMSDSVPATIEGVQEARLANDEFVVPADVVADIGNGSSSAGAKKLYDMMARIREARHGTTEQPPEINAEQFMPA